MLVYNIVSLGGGTGRLDFDNAMDTDGSISVFSSRNKLASGSRDSHATLPYFPRPFSCLSLDSRLDPLPFKLSQPLDNVSCA